MLKFIKSYFVDKFSPLVRGLHYSVLFLVVAQIIISNFIEVEDNGEIGQNIIEFSATWMHISIGLVLVLLAITLLVVELKKYSMGYFYPYLWGDISQLKIDIKHLTQRQMPEVTPKGLVAIVQGLGLGALLLVVLSGAAWFSFWLYGSALADDVKELHELLTTLIEIYIIAHGSMGLLHIFMAYKKQKTANV